MPTYLSPNSDIVIDDAGNFAFGSFDIEAWYTSFRAIHLSDSVALSWSKTANIMNIVTNCYQFDATTWRYRANGFASRILIEDEKCTFMHANAGLIDTDIIWVVDLVIKTNSKVTVGDDLGGNNGKLAVQPNNANDLTQVGGILYATTGKIGNILTGEDPLASFTVKGNTLLNSSQSIRFRAYGVTAGTAGAKTLRVKYDGALVCSKALITGSANSWIVQGSIHYDTGGTLDCDSVILEGTTSKVEVITLSKGSTGDNVLSVTGEGIATDDIKLWGLQVWWDDKNA